MDRVGPTNPYHISKAYGVASPSRVAPSSQSQAVFPIRPTTRTDSVDASTTRAAAAKQRISTLVAARVTELPETGTTAQAPAATQARAGAFPMYRHPADKNAAATAVNAGRVLDVNG
jgi:hypothetical protein